MTEAPAAGRPISVDLLTDPAGVPRAQAMLQRAQWERILLKSGFSETTSLPGLQGPQGEGQMGLLARKAWTETSAWAGG